MKAKDRRERDRVKTSLSKKIIHAHVKRDNNYLANLRKEY